MAETEIAMPESAPVDSRPAFAIVEDLKAKFGENFYVQTTFEDFPTVWVERARVQEVLMYLRTVPRPYVMLFDLSAVDERLRTHRDDLPASDFKKKKKIVEQALESDFLEGVLKKLGRFNNKS